MLESMVNPTHHIVGESAIGERRRINLVRQAKLDTATQMLESMVNPTLLLFFFITPKPRVE